jgi:glycosyltransferase involved in cell wall biosynthesis
MDDFNGHIPFISVAVPLYNKERYVKRAIDSILAQTLTDFEIVVVDDGSTDGSANVVARIDDRRIRLIRQENGGEGAARNRGIREAKGDLIAMLDADDAWHPDFLQAIADLYASYPQAGIFATGYKTIYSNDFIVETTLNRRVLARDTCGLVTDYFQFAQLGNFVWSSAQAIPKAIYQRIGLFVENEPMGPDLEMWGRVALQYPVAYDVRTLAYYHNDATGRVVTQWAKKPTFPPFVRSARRAITDGLVSEEKQPYLESYLNHLLLQYLAQVIAAGDRDELQRALAGEFYSFPHCQGELRYLRLASQWMPMRILWFVERLRRSRYFGYWRSSGDQPVIRRPIGGAHD